MEEQLQKLYEWSKGNNHIPANITYEQFSAKVGNEQGLRAYYDRLSSVPTEGSQYGAAGADWNEFSAAYLPKKKEPTSADGSIASATSSLSGDAPAPIAPIPSAPEQAPWEQVLAQTTPASQTGPRTIDLSSPEAFRNIGQEREGAGPFAQTLTGDEDPIAFGELVKSTLPDYDYKKIYESKTELRRLGRNMDNIAVYGQQARKQTQAAEKNLEEKFGKGWDRGLENMATMMEQIKPDPTKVDVYSQESVEAYNKNVDEYQKIADQYNKIVSDPDFQEYQNGLKAQKRGYDEFMAYQERPEVRNKMRKAAAAQAMANIRGDIPELLQLSVPQPGQQSGAVNWAIRKGAQLLGGALSLPRTISGALPDDWVAKDFRFADEMASIGDELVESANINYPKPSQLNKPLYEKSIEFEGRTVVVDAKGKPTSVRDKEGNEVKGVDEAPEGGTSFLQRFEDSGKAKDATLNWSGSVASTLDKTLDVAADLMIYRYLGRGTKPGVVASSMAMSHQQAYSEAIQAGMLPQDAAEYAFFSSLGVGMLEAYIGNIETTFAKPAVAQAVQLGKKEALALAGKASSAQKAWTALKPVFKQVGEENVEEIAQSIYSDVTRAAYNKMTGAEMDMETTKEGMAETVLLTTLVTAPAAMAGIGANANQYRMSALMAAVKNPDRFNSLMSEFVGNGVIDESQSAALQARIGQLAAFNENLPVNMQDDDRAHVLALQEYRDSQARIAESDRYVDAQRATARDEVKKVDAIIGEIVSKAQGPKADEATDAKAPQSVVNNVLAPEPEGPVHQEEAKPVTMTVEPQTVYEPVVAPEVVAMLPEEVQPVVTGEVFNDRQATVEELIPKAIQVTKITDASTSGDVLANVDTTTDVAKAVEDRITEAAIGALEEKGHVVTPEEVPAIQAFVVPEMTDPTQINDPQEHPAEAINRLTDEYMVENDIQPVKVPLPEQRKAILDQMDEAMPKKGAEAFGQFSESLGNKFSAIHAAMTENTPEWREFEKNNKRAAGLAKAAFRKVAQINEQIKLERDAAQQPAPTGPVTVGAETTPVQNVQQDTGNLEGGQVEGGIKPADVQPGDTVDRAEELANESVSDVESAVFQQIEAQQAIDEVPLPDKPDESNITQLVANGSISSETAALAMSDLPGSEAAQQEVMDAMPDIKKDMTQERADAVETGDYNDMATAHHIDEVLDRPAFVETDTEFVVTRSTHIRDIMRDMGGKWTPGRGWVFPLSKKEQVLAAINRPVNPSREMNEKGSPGMAGRLGAAMRDSNIYRLASQRRKRIAKGRSLEERLRIAQEEIRIAEDERLARVTRVAERLQKAFPGVEIVTDAKEFAAAAKTAFQDAENPPAGFVLAGKVYYDLDRTGVDTPIHEFGHVWNALMATHFPEQHKAGLETMRGSEYEAAVREDARYSGLDDAGVLDEAIALAIGERGARIMNASRWQRFQMWLDGMWMSVKGLLKADPFTMTAQQYADYAATKLLSGNEVFPETSAEIARLEKHAKAMFIGEGAELSEQARADLDAARMMEDKGHDNRQIWLATNWRRGVDGKWRFEISDENAKLITTPGLIQPGDIMALDEVIQHDELFAMYPEMRNMPVAFVVNSGESYLAAVATKDGARFILVNRANGGKGDLRLSLLHEAQHIVQSKEGFAFPVPFAKSDDDTIKRIKELVALSEQVEGKEKESVVAELDTLVEKIKKDYLNQAAEVEARNTQARADLMMEERRVIPPEMTEDVAPEEQTVLFENGKAFEDASTPGFSEEGELFSDTTPYARAHFGSEELRNAGIRNSAIQLIEIEITEGSVPRDRAVPQIAAGLGLDEAFVDQLWNEAEARIGKGALKINIGGRANETIKAKLNRWARRQFSYKGLLPRDVFHDAQKMDQNIAAINYMAEKQAKDLDKAINAYIRSRETRMSRKAQQDFRQLVNNVMNGKADWELLPDEVAVQARVLRNTIDRLSRELLLSGAFGPHAIVTVMENMGIVIDNSVDGAEFSVAINALSKPPYERTDEENLLVDAFLEKHKTQFGTYLNRSYRIHSYPDWINRIPQDVWNRARRYYINQFVERRNQLEQIVSKRDEKDQEKLDKLNEERDQVKTLIGTVVDELEAKVEAIDIKTSFPRPADANIDLDDLGDTVEAIRDFIGKVREELQRIGNIENAEMVELDSMIGPNAQALSGWLRQYRSLNTEIAALEFKMEQRVEDAARELDIVNNNLANIDRFMRQELIEQQKSIDVLMTGGQLGAKPTSILKKRKDIPEEIQALYGVYQDPVINFSQSVMKMAQLLESQKFLNRLRSRYEGVYFFQDGKQTTEADTRIAAQGNARMAPMDGWYTTPDIADALKDFYNADNVSQWEKLWGMYVVNAVKLGKTILSPVTQARNFWGNVSFMVANGWNPYRMWQAWKEYGDMWNKMDERQWRKYATRLHELGVFGNSVNAKDIEHLRNTLGFENAPKEDYGSFVEDKVMGSLKFVKNLPRNTFEVAQKMYEAGDAFYKLMGFENEKRRYSRAWFGRSFDELSNEQQAEIEERAAQIVKSVLPTYSYVPRIVKNIRRLPFVGTFVAFPAEMVRVTYNGYALAAEEMRDPRTRSFGVLRSLGYSTALSASWALVQIAKSLFGYDDDEWDDANKFVSEYQKNAMLLPLPRDKNGNMRYANLSYTDPFSFLSKTINAGFDDPNQTPAGRAVSMFQEMTSPFLSPELSFWTFMQLAMNVDDRGQTIRKKAYQDDFFDSNYLAEENMKRQFDFARKKLQPGLVKSIWDAYDIAHVNADKAGRIKEWSDFLLNHAFGLNIERIDPAVSYSFAMKALMDERNEARAGYTAVQGQLNRAWKSTQQKFEEMSAEEVAAKTLEFDKMATERLKAQYQVSKSAYLRILKDAHKTTKALMRLGATEKQVRDILKEAKFGQKNHEIDAIISGNTESVILQFKKKEKY